MERNNKEIQVGESRLWLGDDNILYYTIIGDTDKETAIRMKEATFKIHNMVEGKINVLIDINKAGKQSSGARKIGREMFEHEKNNKIAIFGMHLVARVTAAFVIGVTKKKDIRFFKTREEALMWLKE